MTPVSATRKANTISDGSATGRRRKHIEGCTVRTARHGRRRAFSPESRPAICKIRQFSSPKQNRLWQGTSAPATRGNRFPPTWRGGRASRKAFGLETSAAYPSILWGQVENQLFYTCNLVPFPRSDVQQLSRLHLSSPLRRTPRRSARRSPVSRTTKRGREPPLISRQERSPRPGPRPSALTPSSASSHAPLPTAPAPQGRSRPQAPTPADHPSTAPPFPSAASSPRRSRFRPG